MQVPQAVKYLATSEGRTRLLELIFKQNGPFTTDELLERMNEVHLNLHRTLVTTFLRVLVTKGLLSEDFITDDTKRRGRKRSIFRRPQDMWFG